MSASSSSAYLPTVRPPRAAGGGRDAAGRFWQRVGGVQKKGEKSFFVCVVTTGQMKQNQNKPP